MSPLLLLSTMAVAGDATDIGAIVNKSIDAVAPVIKDATTLFFKGAKRLHQSCNVRECEAPWICYRKQCQECQIGDEKELVDGLKCKFPKICMPMPHDPSKKGCLDPAEWVNCGGHYAKSCKACPGGNDKNYCNGDCEWFVPAGSANASTEVGKRTDVASGSPVYHTYMVAPPVAEELLPFCRAKATTAAPPEGKIDCSRDAKNDEPKEASDSQICSAKKNCIWVWDGSGLDLATQTAKPPVKDEEEDEEDKQKTSQTTTLKETSQTKTLKETQPILTEKKKSGKCYVLESYLDLPGVQSFKTINKQMGNNMDPERRSGSIYDGICDKHSSWRSDANRGVCEEENELGVTCAWWNTRVFGGRCVVVKETDIITTSGGKCLIPFYHNDVLYDGCTTAPRGLSKKERDPWCKVDLRTVGKTERFRRRGVAKCGPDAPISTGKKNGEEESDAHSKGDSRKAMCPVNFEFLEERPGKQIKIIKIEKDAVSDNVQELEFCANECRNPGSEEECQSFKIVHPYWPMSRAQCILYKQFEETKKKTKKKTDKEEMCFKSTETDGTETDSGAPLAPEAKSSSSLKQRTTQSFIAADNWE